MMTTVWLLGMTILPGCLDERTASPSPLPPDEHLADQLRRITGEGSRIHETDHFTIAYDMSYEVLRPLVGRLEGTHDAIWRFCEAGGLDLRPLQERLQVVFFDKQEDYARHCREHDVSPEATAGFYDPGTNLAVFSNTLTRPELRKMTREMERIQEQLKNQRSKGSGAPSARQRRETLRRRLKMLRNGRDAIVERFNRLVIQHEAAHQMFFNLGVHVHGADNPTWLVEGLACQFEVPQTRLAKGMGRVNHLRLGDFREALSVPPRAKNLSEVEYAAVFEARRLLPLGDLVGNREAFGRDEGRTAFRYAQAWALVYYLNREHREALAAYLSRLSTRLPGRIAGPEREIKDFETVFGPLDEPFQRAWVSYMLKLRFDRKEAGY